MKTYTTVNDCWAKIREYWNNQETTDEEDVEHVRDLCGDFPNRFGEWTVDEEDGYITVTNKYWDRQLDDWYEESEDFELNPPALHLEIDDLINYDEGLNNIAVDKQVFDDFDEGAIVTVYFVDLPDDSPLPKKSEYQMESEDECCIYMTIFA